MPLPLFCRRHFLIEQGDWWREGSFGARSVLYSVKQQLVISAKTTRPDAAIATSKLIIFRNLTSNVIILGLFTPKESRAL